MKKDPNKRLQSLIIFSLLLPLAGYVTYHVYDGFNFPFYISLMLSLTTIQIWLDQLKVVVSGKMHKDFLLTYRKQLYRHIRNNDEHKEYVSFIYESLKNKENDFYYIYDVHTFISKQSDIYFKVKKSPLSFFKFPKTTKAQRSVLESMIKLNYDLMIDSVDRSNDY